MSTYGSGEEAASGDEEAEAMQRPRTPQRSAGVRVRGKGEAKARRRAPAAREEHGAPRKARPAAMAVETGGGDERGFGSRPCEEERVWIGWRMSSVLGWTDG